MYTFRHKLGISTKIFYTESIKTLFLDLWSQYINANQKKVFYHKMITCYLFISTSKFKFNLLLEKMECIFCNTKTYLINRHYHFLHGKLKSSNVDSQKCVSSHTPSVQKSSWIPAWGSLLYSHYTMHNGTDTISCSRQQWKIYWFLVCQWNNDQSTWCMSIGRLLSISYPFKIAWW